MDASRALLLRGQHVAQLVLAAYGGFLSYQAVVRLQKYEKTSEKLADWSKEAARQLRLTRTTQAAGAVAILASTVSALTLAVYYTSLDRWVRFAISPANLLLVMAARTHMKNYWAPKDGQSAAMKIPLPNMKAYSEATEHTEDLLRTLEYLEYSWVATSFFNAMAM